MLFFCSSDENYESDTMVDHPAPRGHGPSRPVSGGVATPGEAVRGVPNPGSLSQLVKSYLLYATGGRYLDCAERDRESSRGDPVRPLQAAGVQASSQSLPPDAHAATARV